MFKYLCILFLLFAFSAQAGDFKYFRYTEVNTGVAYSAYEDQAYCYGSGSKSRTIGTFSINQNIIQYHRSGVQVELNIGVTHGSCLVNRDRYVTDMFGPQIKFRKYWL